MKLNEVQANNLKVLLASVPREALHDEKAPVLGNKWQAMTCRTKILNAIREVNADFEKKLEAIDKYLAKAREEVKAIDADYSEPKDEKPEDKKSRLKEKEKAVEAVNKKLEKDIEKDGLKVAFYGQISLVSYLDEKDAKEVKLELNEEHKQLEFIKDQMERNIFEMRIPEDALAELAETLGM